MGSRIIVEILPLEKEQVKSEGGVIIADAEQMGLSTLLKRLRGKILRKGSNIVDAGIVEGATVLFEEYAGIPVDNFNPDIVWMEEDQIVAIETEE